MGEWCIQLLCSHSPERSALRGANLKSLGEKTVAWQPTFRSHWRLPEVLIIISIKDQGMVLSKNQKEAHFKPSSKEVESSKMITFTVIITMEKTVCLWKERVKIK